MTGQLIKKDPCKAYSKAYNEVKDWGASSIAADGVEVGEGGALWKFR